MLFGLNLALPAVGEVLPEVRVTRCAPLAIGVRLAPASVAVAHEHTKMPADGGAALTVLGAVVLPAEARFGVAHRAVEVGLALGVGGALNRAVLLTFAVAAGAGARGRGRADIVRVRRIFDRIAKIALVELFPLCAEAIFLPAKDFYAFGGAVRQAAVARIRARFAGVHTAVACLRCRAALLAIALGRRDTRIARLSDRPACPTVGLRRAALLARRGGVAIVVFGSARGGRRTVSFGARSPLGRCVIGDSSVVGSWGAGCASF